MIKLDTFIGEIPTLENHLLPDNASSAALNCKYNTGGLTAMRANSPIDGITQRPLFNSIDSSTQAIYLYDNGDDYFLFQNQDKQASFVSNPLADDAHNRTYWSDVTGVRFVAKAEATTAGVYPTQSYDLGVPAPSIWPSITINTLAEASGGMTATGFVYTFVSQYGEEGAPSAPTSSITVYDDTDLTVTAPVVPVNFDILITKYRTYMISGGYYLLLAEQVINSNSTLVLSAVTLGEDISTIEYALPLDGLQGLTALPGGFIAGFVDNTLCFSESFLPYAWPAKYQLPFEERIVGIVPTYNGLLVATDGRPYVVTGTSPFGMSPMPLDTVLPCVSHRSIVDMGEYALYVSPDGIVAMEGGKAKLVTAEVFTQKQWEALVPSTMQAYRQDNNYLVITTAGKTFSFDPSKRTITYMDFGVDIKCCCYNADAKLLALTTNDELLSLDTGVDNLAFSWESKIYQSDMAYNFTDARVRATGNMVFTIAYMDSDNVELSSYSRNITSAATFRLPARVSERVQVRLAGDSGVSKLAVGNAPGEV